MGKIYRLHCNSCGWQDTVYIGEGAGDRRYADAALLALQTGPYGEQAFECLLRYPDVSVKLERAVYRCKHCGKFETRLQTSLKIDDDKYVQAYYCSACGKILGKVRSSALKMLPCPECGGEICSENLGQWEIAPEVEYRCAPLEPASNIIPVAVNCFTRTSGGETEYIAIKSEQQLARLTDGREFAAETYENLSAAHAAGNAYLTLYCPESEAIWVTCPLSELSADEKGILELKRQLTELYKAQAGHAESQAEPIKLGYISGEPFLCVTIEGCLGLLTRGMWTSPLLEQYSSSIERILIGRRPR